MQIADFLKYHPSLNHAADLKEICKPLEKLGITYFAHVQFTRKDKFSAIANSPEYFKFYFENGYYDYDVHANTPLDSQRYVLWDHMAKFGKTNEMFKIAFDFGLCHTITIIQKEEKVDNYYHFSTNRDDESMNDFYVQHIDLLEKFIRYYQEKVLLCDRIGRAYDLHCVKGQQQSQSTIDYNLPEHLSNNDIKFYLCEIEQANHKAEFSETIFQLSRREHQCAFLLLQGKTSKEIAEVLHISPRTVEVYFERLKSRFGSKNKIHLARHLMEAELLDIDKS